MRNEFSGFASFGEDLRDFADDIDLARRRAASKNGVVDQAVERSAREAFDGSQRDVPVKSGELRDSGQVFRRSDGVWVIRYTADHAAAIEKGAKPHVIEARNAETLRFETETGEVVYRVRVRHPGNEAQPFLKPNIDAQRAELPPHLGEEFEGVLRGVFG